MDVVNGALDLACIFTSVQTAGKMVGKLEVLETLRTRAKAIPTTFFHPMNKSH